MKAAIAKPLSAVIIIVSCIVLFLNRDEVVEAVSAFMFLVGVVVFMTTAFIEAAEGR